MNNYLDFKIIYPTSHYENVHIVSEPLKLDVITDSSEFFGTYYYLHKKYFQNNGNVNIHKFYSKYFSNVICNIFRLKENNTLIFPIEILDQGVTSLIVTKDNNGLNCRCIITDTNKVPFDKFDYFNFMIDKEIDFEVLDVYSLSEKVKFDEDKLISDLWSIVEYLDNEVIRLYSK